MPDPSESETESLTLTSVCEKLDSLSLDYLTLLQDYVNLALGAQALQQEGNIHLAKARFLEGPTSLPPKARLPSQQEESSATATATFRVIRSAEGGGRSVVQEEESGKIQFSTFAGQDKKAAVSKFRKCLTLSLERADVADKLESIREEIQCLKNLKDQLQLPLPS